MAGPTEFTCSGSAGRSGRSLRTRTCGALTSKLRVPNSTRHPITLCDADPRTMPPRLASPPAYHALDSRHMPRSVRTACSLDGADPCAERLSRAVDRVEEVHGPTHAGREVRMYFIARSEVRRNSTMIMVG
jgi:hypothetical protein